MSLPAEPASPSLPALLRGAVADLQRASGADIVSLFLYDEEGHEYYAPFAVGQPEDSLLDSLADMRAQLNLYLADREQGKVADELRVPQYGSTVWLTVTRQPLVARDAQTEIGSSFVRRYQVQSTLGLPLQVGDRMLGLVYMNFCGPADAESEARLPDAERLAALRQQAAAVAAAIQATLARAERQALESIRRLTVRLAAPVTDVSGDAGQARRLLSIALADLLRAGDLEGAAIYDLTPQHDRLELVTAHAPAALPLRVELPGEREQWIPALCGLLDATLAPAGLHPAGAFPLGEPDQPEGYVIVLSRDRLADARRAPATRVLLETAAHLLHGVLATRRLVVDLADSNRLLGALADMTNAMLRPGSSLQDVLDAVVGHLTDASVPEFDFHFATVYLLDEVIDHTVVARTASGATTIEAIDAAQVERRGTARRTRVPRWALQRERALPAQDVLVFVARARQVVVVGPAPVPGASAPGELVTGGITEAARWLEVPVVRSGGEMVTRVPACLIGEPATAAEAGAPEGEVPFTLDGDIFEASGHADLTRIFLPFGLEPDGLASGALEVGYHRSLDRRPDWGQIEALRAAAAQVAVAVETARLQEEARHHAEQLELSADISEAIASSIDLEHTLRMVARNLVRLVDASLCQIALYDEDGVGWFGAAASDQEELWQRQRGERPERSFLFEVVDRGEPLAIEHAAASELVSREYVEAFGVQSLLAVPLIADGQPIGAAVLAERDETRAFTADEVRRVQGVAHQAAVAIKNARLHALAEEERHIQKDFILVGFGQWGQKAYQHLQTLKQFFNFRVHVVEHDSPDTRERLAAREAEVLANGDAFVWDGASAPAHDHLERQLESSCYAITYIATPAATHLPTLVRYYDLSDVILIEKPLGAAPEAYREFLEGASGGVQLVAADHYYFKLEVRLLQQLLTVERTLRDFLDSVEEIRVEILEANPLAGAAADIGVIADLVPHAFAIISLFTPIDRLQLAAEAPLLIGRHESLSGQRESYARVNATFPYQRRFVRLVVDVGKGVEDAKWIRLNGERRLSGRQPFYKFDFGRGQAIDGTQSTVRAAVREIREPGVPDNAHLTMLRHVIERQRPAVGILSIREAIRANQRVRELEALAGELLAREDWTPYPLGTRPRFGREDGR